MKAFVIGAMVAGSSMSGCVTAMPIPLGAQSIFTRSYACPEERVTVTPRPDVVPHTLLKSRPPSEPPPPEVVADPERMRLWASLHPPDPDVDAIGEAYEVTGCGQKVMYVCAHPVVDSHSGAFSATMVLVARTFQIGLHTPYYDGRPRGVIVSDDSVMTTVVCLPEGQAP